jgi:acyl dehydratase
MVEITFCSLYFFLTFAPIKKTIMSKTIISNFETLESLIGQEIGVSDYHQITQEQINLFAEATLDFQWIHTDVERAKTESPFGNTIAHGYLTLSLLPYLWAQIVEVQNLKLQVNYGIEKFKFNQPVPVNSKVRLVAKVVSAVNLRGVVRANIGVKLEIEGNRKPAYEGEVVFLYHFL